MELPDFYRRVATRLGILPVGATVAADDAEVIREAYVGLVAELSEHMIAMWDADDPVPEPHSEPLIAMVAAKVADDFGITDPRRAQLVMDGAFGLPVASIAERRLRALTRLGPTDDAVAEYL
jgi:hypothetical protein